MININKYVPGRFAYLMDEPFVRELWEFLADDTRIEQMERAIKKGKPAIEPFLSELESTFGEYLSSKEYPAEEICVLANNMTKQILALKGYEHVACGICPTAKYIKNSGLYEKRE